MTVSPGRGPRHLRRAERTGAPDLDSTTGLSRLRQEG
jgi:hypothetical protein